MAKALQTIDFKTELAKYAERVQGDGGQRIRINNQGLLEGPNGETDSKFDVVIVNFVYYNVRYLHAWQPDVIEAPECFAIGLAHDNLIPSPDSPSKPKCASCNECKYNQFPESGGQKVCKNRALVACLPFDATDKTPFLSLSIPPTALREFKLYIRSLVHGVKRPPYSVISLLKATSKKNYIIPVFGNPQPIEDDERIRFFRSRQEDALKLLYSGPKLENAANDSKKPIRRRA